MWLNQDLPLGTYFFSAIKKVGKKISAAGKMAKMNYPCSNRSELAQTKATRPSHCPRSLPQRNPTHPMFVIDWLGDKQRVNLLQKKRVKRED